MGANSEDTDLDFDELIPVQDGAYKCPICYEYRADSVRSVQGHISGTRDDLHEDLGWNYEAEIRATRQSE
ncbi:MAG: hypothetical protein ACOCYZ_04540 [Halococcoides sp.]